MHLKLINFNQFSKIPIQALTSLGGGSYDVPLFGTKVGGGDLHFQTLPIPHLLATVSLNCTLAFMSLPSYRLECLTNRIKSTIHFYTFTATGLSTCQSSQTNRWENHLGVFRTSPCDVIPDRKALTEALVHFSRALGYINFCTDFLY